MRRLALALLLCLAGSAYAASWQAELQAPRLVGEGDFRYFGFRIYTARLWTERSAEAIKLNASAPFALELTYHRAISRQQFVDSSVDEIKRIFGKQVSDVQLAAWQGQMQRAFTDVKEGEQLIGVYLPGIGCRFYSRNALLAEVPDPAFARAFFAIWLDEKTRDSGLRQQLLGAKP